MTRFTYQDAIDHLVDYLGGESAQLVRRDSKRAVLSAYRDFANAHNWSYLYRQGRINTNAPLDSATGAGTIQYQATAGDVCPRQVTLAGGTWPSWANLGYLRVGISPPVNYKIKEVFSPTVAQLDWQLSPAEDLPPATAFTLYQDTYLLPDDFIAMDQALFLQNFGGMQYTHPRDWVFENRYVYANGTPQFYTIIGNQSVPGRLLMAVFPIPQTASSIDFPYKRRPRQLLTDLVTSGTVSVTEGSTTVNGSSTGFAPHMIGSVLRLGSTTACPTSMIGPSPYVFEGVIDTYVSPSVLTLSSWTVPVTTLTGVKYAISDPIDIEEGAMLTAFQRGCEAQIAMSRTLKDKPSARLQYADALEDAKAADSRSFMGRFEGQSNRFVQRLRDMPMGPDQY